MIISFSSTRDLPPALSISEVPLERVECQSSWPPSSIQFRMEHFYQVYYIQSVQTTPHFACS